MPGGELLDGVLELLGGHGVEQSVLSACCGPCEGRSQQLRGAVADDLGILRRPGLDLLQPAAEHPCLLHRLILQPAEDAGVEEPLEQLLLLRAAGVQELGELALRQQDHLGELRPVQRQDLVHLLAHGLGAAGGLAPDGAVVLLQHRRRIALHAAVLRPSTGPGVLGRAGDPAPSPVQAELQDHLRDAAGRGVVALQSARVAPAGHVAVEGEGDRVQHCGLARSGATVEQEEPVGAQRVEVDALGAGEGAEGRQRQGVDLHRTPPVSARTAASASSMSPRSSSEAPRPRTWARKAPTTSGSVRAASTAAE